MIRLWGEGEKNDRVADYVSDSRFECISYLLLCLSGVDASIMFRVLKWDILFFTKYVLASTLSVGGVVFLDNLSSHKVVGVLNLVFEWGVYVWFLPMYYLI